MSVHHWTDFHSINVSLFVTLNGNKTSHRWKPKKNSNKPFSLTLFIWDWRINCHFTLLPTKTLLILVEVNFKLLLLKQFTATNPNETLLCKTRMAQNLVKKQLGRGFLIIYGNFSTLQGRNMAVTPVVIPLYSPIENALLNLVHVNTPVGRILPSICPPIFYTLEEVSLDY